ncbi:hypothetical protein [endosymbiont GvMRE of Glomus versiforme]|uniref:hypothetical protein n=1 Tax=endosymbiont GvMRE of Glomus versiforme TaxID=2039283 RepID=UPI000EE2EDF4|nr:hypothetical protein [endosymbiont GvMRE of Glomus versiforme]RHZ37395.1 hypothetical protein GvMRE_I1g543 [endosymbiont GvMRE of Glomus versiforme]
MRINGYRIMGLMVMGLNILGKASQYDQAAKATVGISVEYIHPSLGVASKIGATCAEPTAAVLEQATNQYWLNSARQQYTPTWEKTVEKDFCLVDKLY